MAFAVILVVGASLFVRTFRAIVNADLGYQMTVEASGVRAQRRRALSRPATQSAVDRRVHAKSVHANARRDCGRIHCYQSVERLVDLTALSDRRPSVQRWESPSAVLTPRRRSTSRRSACASARAGASHGRYAGRRTGRRDQREHGKDATGRTRVLSAHASGCTDFYVGNASDTLAMREVVGVVSDVQEDAMSEARRRSICPRSRRRSAAVRSSFARPANAADVTAADQGRRAHARHEGADRRRRSTLRDVLSNSFVARKSR